jgi:hypothetical protein
MLFKIFFPNKNMENPSKIKRIIILILIFLCILGIILVLVNSTYQKIDEKNNCKKCLCLGIFSKETTEASFNIKQDIAYSCKGFEFCWKIYQETCN